MTRSARPLARGLAAALSLLAAAPALAAELRTTTRRTLASSSIVRTADTSLVQESAKLPSPEDALLAEPVEAIVAPCDAGSGGSGGELGLPDDGSLVICGPDSGIEIEGATSGSSGAGAPAEPPEPQAYDLFAPYHNGPNPLQAYLMAVAAFYIYVPLDFEGDEADFPAWLEDTMAGYGLETEYLSDEATDTEGAVFWNDDVVILTFRGTTPGADMRTDAQKNFRRMPDSWGEDVLVHNGFAVSWEHTRPDVLDALDAQLVGGRRLWITGHSLGGAIATLAAYDLEHVEGIPVEAVHTFGQPRVGADAFHDAFDAEGLFPRFHRWQLEGDPIPAFFDGGSYVVCGWICTLGLYAYEHVGRTHDILVDGPHGSFSYEIETDVEDHELWWHLGGAEIEHVKYDDALMARLEETEKASLLDLLPPVALDSTGSGLLP